MSLILSNKVALVTGASRGAGRGIALELSLTGAIVYITGRSRTDHSTSQYTDLTLDETQVIIKKAGGIAIAITCDHTQQEQIQKVFDQIQQEAGRLDILVNNVWGGYMGEHGKLDVESVDFMGEFWNQPVWRWDRMFNTGPRAHFIANSLAAPMMIKQKSGLIVTTSFWDEYKYISNLPYDLVKACKNRMAFGMAIELQPHNVTAITLGLGWIRTEHLKRMYDLDDYNYKNEGNEGKEGFELTESTRFAGRAIVAMAKDEKIMKHSGKILTTAEAARMYNFTDLDGTQPKIFHIPDRSEGTSQR
ncbi:MAG: SDR family NAD(P)-dependent oxidoreductase [Promethearchaeota archaeon]